MSTKIWNSSEMDIAEKDPEPRWPHIPLHQEWFDTPGGIKVYVKLYEKLNHLIPTS